MSLSLLLRRKARGGRNPVTMAGASVVGKYQCNCHAHSLHSFIREIITVYIEIFARRKISPISQPALDLIGENFIKLIFCPV